MKKILLLIVTLAITVTSYAQFPEGFDGATFPPTGWTSFVGANGLGTVENWKQQEYGAPNNTAVCVWEVLPAGQRSEDWLVTPQFTVDASAPLLYFDGNDSGATEYGSIYTVRVSTASQTTHADFTIVNTQTEAEIIHDNDGDMTGNSVVVDLSAYIGQSIYVAFVLEQNDGDLWRIDNVDMIDNFTPVTAPNPVTNLTPLDGAIDVYVDPTDNNADLIPDNGVAFDWDPSLLGDAATSFDVYLGDSAATLALLGSTANDAVNITGMEYSTTYYWQIVATNSGGEAVGSSIWSFTTQADPTASTNEEVLASNVKIYPTTVDAQFTIENNSSIALTKANIIDVNGRLVANHNLNDLVGSTTIDVSNLNAGLYFVELQSNSNKLVKKIVKK